MIGSQDLLVGLLLQESTRSRMDALSPLRRCGTLVKSLESLGPPRSCEWSRSSVVRGFQYFLRADE